MSLKQYLKTWHKGLKEEGYEVAFIFFVGLLVLAYYANLTALKIKKKELKP